MLINGYSEYAHKYFNNVRKPDPHFIQNLNSTANQEVSFLLWLTKDVILPPIRSLHHEYDIWHGFNITYRKKEYCELFCFAFSKNSDDKSQFFLQNSPLLTKFCDYFRVKAIDLIDDCNKSKLALYADKFDLYYMEEMNRDINQFLKKINNENSLYLTNKKGDLVHLTPRELDCISIFMKNRTMKEIGKILDLSPRTVENHIGNIKQKLEVNYKSQLIDIFSNIYGTNNGVKL